MKKRIYLVQVNNAYGENVYLPYSVGLLWAYASQRPDVLNEWELAGLLYRKEPIECALKQIEAPELVAISCYIWNWRWSLALSRGIKERWPCCSILVGGVQIPEESPEVLLKHPELDLAIYGEGEGAFADFLVARDLSKVGSLIWKNGEQVVVNRRHTAVPVETLRSPYLDGVFDSILGESPRWQVAQETNRGCPYHCSFCAWGQAALDKVRKIPMENVLAEIDWFAKLRSPYVDNCDANFGILPRDDEIVEALCRSKHDTGYPERFRTSWAKNSNRRVFDMAKKLNAEGLLKAVTLSMQSMDDQVLRIVQRKNIRYDDLGDLIRDYEAEGISTYTELIMGLPGENLASYITGIDRVLDAGQHSGLFLYPCLILPNTEMARPDYRERYGIRTAMMRAMLTHGTPLPGIHEEQEIIVETTALPHSDWRYSYLYSWVVQTFHVLGLTQHLARSLRKLGTPYSTFYGKLQLWVEEHPETVAGREYLRVVCLLNGVINGGSWDLIDSRFGSISWPSEEFGFLQIACEADRFYEELTSVLEPDHVAKQSQIFVRPEPGHEEEYAREAVWYGRKGSGIRKRLREVA